MSVHRIPPSEAARLMTTEGYAYLDVRSVPEFQQGHPEGAYNVPLAHLGPGGMTPNLDFLEIVERHFPRDAALVVGCKSGGRSLQAASLLISAGFTRVVEQRCGFHGGFGPGGPEPGWQQCGLPISNQALAGRDFDSLDKAS